MHHHNNTHTFIDSLLQSQHQFMQAMADHRDQLSETMSSMAHTYLDTSIDRLKRFHDHVANDASGLKSDMLDATLKAAIDQHLHLKDRLTVHKHHANSHKQTLRRLAMGVMATFGVMSGVKAADAFDPGQGNGGAHSSTSTTQQSASEASNYQTKVAQHNGSSNAGTQGTAATSHNASASQSAALYQARPAAYYRDPMALANQPTNADSVSSGITTLPSTSAASDGGALTREALLQQLEALVKSNHEQFQARAESQALKEKELADNLQRQLKEIQEFKNEFKESQTLLRAEAEELLDSSLGLEGTYKHSEKFKERAGKYLKAAYATDATSKTITKSADEIFKMASKLSESPLKTQSFAIVLDLLKKTANHPDASVDDIFHAAEMSRSTEILSNEALKMNALKQAAEFFEKAANHEDVTNKVLRLAVQAIIDLGPAYHDRAAAITERVAKWEASIEDIRWAANIFRDLEKEYRENNTKRKEFEGKARLAETLIDKKFDEARTEWLNTLSGVKQSTEAVNNFYKMGTSKNKTSHEKAYAVDEIIKIADSYNYESYITLVNPDEMRNISYQYYPKAVTILKGLLSDNPNNMELKTDIAEKFIYIGNAYPENSPQRIQYHNISLDICLQIANDVRQPLNVRENAAYALIHLGGSYTEGSKLGQESYKKASDLLEELATSAEFASSKYKPVEKLINYALSLRQTTSIMPSKNKTALGSQKKVYNSEIGQYSDESKEKEILISSAAKLLEKVPMHSSATQKDIKWAAELLKDLSHYYSESSPKRMEYEERATRLQQALKSSSN
jgi:hypothetical protein